MKIGYFLQYFRKNWKNKDGSIIIWQHFGTLIFVKDSYSRFFRLGWHLRVLHNIGQWFQNILTTEFDHPCWDFIWPCCLVDIEFSKFIINYTFINFAKLKARIWLDFRGNFTFEMLIRTLGYQRGTCTMLTQSGT